MAFTVRLSSGLFGLPSGAQAVDWSVVNDSAAQQDVRVTVFAGPIVKAKEAAAPGAVEMSIEPNVVVHNVNDVGPGKLLQQTCPSEVVVQVNDLKMQATVEVWSDHGGNVIQGTRIGPRDFIRLARNWSGCACQARRGSERSPGTRRATAGCDRFARPPLGRRGQASDGKSAAGGISLVPPSKRRRARLMVP